MIPYYNGARFIGEALASVRAQTVRAVYARDFALLRRMLRRASRRDVTMSVVLSRIAWRVIGNRWRRTDRVASRTPAVTTDESA